MFPFTLSASGDQCCWFWCSGRVVGLFCLADSLCIQRFDPGLGLIAPINPMMAGISLVPPPPVPPDMPVIKEIIHCKSCTLFPQNPSKTSACSAVSQQARGATKTGCPLVAACSIAYKVLPLHVNRWHMGQTKSH